MAFSWNKTRTKNYTIHEEEENKTLRYQVRWEEDEEEKNNQRR